MYPLLEIAVVIVAVVVSAAHALQRLAPAPLARLRRTLLIFLLRPARPAPLRALARRFAPAPAWQPGATHCGGCSGCKD
jgi:hypothetical protein